MKIFKCWGARALFACALVGCESAGTPKPGDAASSASAESPPSKLTQALQSAAGSERKAGSAAASGDGPPATGVFGPGLADVAHPPSAPPKVTLLEAGTEPRFVFAPSLPKEGPHALTFTVTKSTQGQPGPPMLYTVEVLFPKAKAAPNEPARSKAASDETEPALDDAGPSGPRPIAFKIRKAGVASDRELPKDILKEVEKLVGTKITATLTLAGSLTEPKLEVPADAKALTGAVEALYETLDLFFSPMPPEAVGVGASWIASDRTHQNGIPVVRYRVTKLEKIERGVSLLSVDVRQYCIGSAAVPKGAPEGFLAMAFESFGRAGYARIGASLLPTGGELKLPLAMQLANPASAGRAGVLQTDLQASVAPAKLAKK